jgi:prepilin-type processing-associated H-X9-DG protein
MNSKWPSNDANGPKSAFTLIELFTVLAVIALISMLLLPALAASKPPAQAFQCLENERRLVLAWRLYSDDYNGRLVLNVAMDTPYWNTSSNWVLGHVDSMPSATNTALITGGLLFPYTKSVAIYKCPADTKISNRSISMNGWLNPVYAWNSAGVVFTNQAAITNPPPANLWVFLDENPATINDGFFVCDPSNPTRWVDTPAVYHSSGSGISFADGHAIIRKWSDPTVLTQISGGAAGVQSQQHPPTDLQWLQARSTVLRPR